MAMSESFKRLAKEIQDDPMINNLSFRVMGGILDNILEGMCVDDTDPKDMDEEYFSLCREKQRKAIRYVMENKSEMKYIPKRIYKFYRDVASKYENVKSFGFFHTGLLEEHRKIMHTSKATDSARMIFNNIPILTQFYLCAWRPEMENEYRIVYEYIEDDNMSIKVTPEVKIIDTRNDLKKKLKNKLREKQNQR